MYLAHVNQNVLTQKKLGNSDILDLVIVKVPFKLLYKLH